MQSWPVFMKYNFRIEAEKCVSICSDSQAALKALQAVRMTSPLVQQCQRALNDISAQYVVGLYWVLDMLEYEATRLPMDSQGVALL